ncbi:MAG: hypothetical protein AB7E72_18150 [Lysobacterales bacterium]
MNARAQVGESPVRLKPTAAVPANNASARPWRHVLLWTGLGLLVLYGARTDAYAVDSDLAYWLGVAGGSAMLILLLYPLRKRLDRYLPLGRLRYWFSGHMVLGIAGPVLILLHCKLSLGSLNAKVAFWSMVVVASSGIVGRFLYAQLHRGLYGRQRSAGELRSEAAAALEAAAPMLDQHSQAHAALAAFARLAADTGRRGLAAPWQQLSLPWKARSIWRIYVADVLSHHGRVEPAHLQRLTTLLQQYLDAACAAARFGAVERLFSLWHVAHLPLVLILVLTAGFHVLAVHMY